MLLSAHRWLSLVAIVGLSSVSAYGAVLTPVDVTGWTQDYVWAVSETSPGTTVTHNGYSYYEQDASHNGGTGGLPAEPTRTFVSAADPDTIFQLAAYDDVNSLDMASGVSGTLTLTDPARFESLSFLGAKGNAGVTIDYSLNFTSGAPTTGSFSMRDWTSPNAITTGLYQSSNGTFPWQGTVGLSEHDVTLSAFDQTRILESITLTHSGGGFSWVMGVSGSEIVPEPSSLTLTIIGLFSLGLFARWRRSR